MQHWHIEVLEDTQVGLVASTNFIGASAWLCRRIARLRAPWLTFTFVHGNHVRGNPLGHRAHQTGHLRQDVCAVRAG